MVRGKYLISVAAILMGLLLVSCETLAPRGFGLEENVRPSKYAAGTIDIATFQPILWHTIAEDLKPNFGIKNAKALLGDVAPIVGGDDYRASRRIAAQLAANLANSTLDKSVTENSTSDIDTDGIETETSSTVINKTVTQSTPEVIEISPAALATIIGTPDKLSEAHSGFSYDPDLKYRAATALFQNIKLLDRYLDTSYGNGKEVYLVRVQITINPFAHQQPYDVYTRLLLEAITPNRSQLTEHRIFPLIIADNLERTNTRRISESLQSIQASLTGRSGSQSTDAGLNVALDRLRTLVGSDLNSLITYTQPDDESLTIRLAAPFNAKSGYSMRARTYDVTFVVAIDDQKIGSHQGDKLGVYAETTLRHARTGKRLPDIAESDIDNLTRRLTKAMQHTKFVDKKGNITTLFDSAVEKNSSGVEKFSGTKPENIVRTFVKMNDNMNTEANAINDVIFYNIGNYHLNRDMHRARITKSAKYSQVAFLDDTYKHPKPQVPVLNDDGKITTIQMVGQSRPVIKKLNAKLYYCDKAPICWSLLNSPIQGPFRSTKLTVDKNLYSFSFPSLAALGLDTSLKKSSTRIELQYASLAHNKSYYPRRMKTAKTPERKLSFSVRQFAKSFTDGIDSKGANTTIVIEPKSKSGTPEDIVKYRLTLIGAKIKQVNQLDEKGNVVPNPNQKTELIELSVSKNSAKFKKIEKATAYKIVLHAIKQKAGEDITVKIEALSSDDKPVSKKIEFVDLKYSVAAKASKPPADNLSSNPAKKK